MVSFLVAFFTLRVLENCLSLIWPLSGVITVIVARGAFGRPDT